MNVKKILQKERDRMRVNAGGQLLAGSGRGGIHKDRRIESRQYAKVRISRQLPTA